LGLEGSLPDCNTDVMHSLYTNYPRTFDNKLWVSCGVIVETHESGP